MARISPAKLECDPAKHETEQHRDDERVGRGKDDGVGKRKGREETASAQHEPCFIAIPDRRDRVHCLIALSSDRKVRKEDADPQIEPVHHDIGEDSKADDTGPDYGEIEVLHVHASRPVDATTPLAGVMPAARCGTLDGSGSPAAGGFAIIRSK